MLTPRRRAIHRDPLAIPIHPLLAAAYPVVFLFATNAAEQVTLEPLWLPLLVSVGAAVALTGLLWLLVRDIRRAALLATVLIIGFFGYGHLWLAVSGLVTVQWPVVVGWLILIVIGLVAAWNSGRFTVPVTKALNVIGVVALVLNASPLIGVTTARGADAAVGEDLTSIDLSPPEGHSLPDVYYIVPDRYAGGSALLETYGYDNEPFLTALEERGFAVARRAHANYIKTPLSLASSMNLEMLDAEELKAEATDGADRGPIHRALSDHLRAPLALKELGYEYVQISNWWEPTATNVDADRVFRYDGRDEFSSSLAQTTLLGAFFQLETAPGDPYDWDVMRMNTHYQLDALDDVPQLPGPKFVFAHLTIPHPPWLIDADGSAMDRAEVAEQGDIDSYVRYLRYANLRLMKAVDRIIARSPNAVIIIQSDEGPFPAEYQDVGFGFSWRDATAAQLEEKFGILLAMRVIGGEVEAEGFTDDMTPVNTFRVVFNARFGTDLPMLPNVTLAHEDLDQFYDFYDITDRLRR